MERLAFVSKESPLRKQIECKTIRSSFTLNDDIHMTFTDGSKVTIKKGLNT